VSKRARTPEQTDTSTDNKSHLELSRAREPTVANGLVFTVSPCNFLKLLTFVVVETG